MVLVFPLSPLSCDPPYAVSGHHVPFLYPFPNKFSLILYVCLCTYHLPAILIHLLFCHCSPAALPCYLPTAVTADALSALLPDITSAAALLHFPIPFSFYPTATLFLLLFTPTVAVTPAVTVHSHCYCDSHTITVHSC